MKKVKRRLFSMVLVLLIVFSGAINILAQNQVVIKLNGREIAFADAKPYMDEVAGRVLVPVRFVAESLGALVEWDEVNKIVDIVKEKTNIRLILGEKRFVLNGKSKLMDTAAFMKDGRTFVPLRFISESLGIDTAWDQKTYTVSLKDEKSGKEFTIQGISLGTTGDEVVATLGEPSRIDASEYGFDWYIYNSDYSKYIQIGVKDNQVVGLYTNADNWKSAKGIQIGMERTKVEDLLGESIKSIRKGNVIYSISSEDEKGAYIIDGSYVTIFYDIHKNNTVTSIQIIDDAVELGLDGYYGEYSVNIRDSFERQMFDIANSIRVRNGLKPFSWSNKAMVSSRKHSQDMADKNYFEHNNLKGQTPFKRMENEGITYVLAAENIAAGSPSAIEAHEGLMNSMGHRVNILGEFKMLGVGVGYNFNNTYKYYYTQNFFTGR